MRKARKWLANEEGQAVVEYVLMLTLAVGVVSLVAIGFKKSLFTLWQTFAQEISASCPGCPPNSQVHITH